MVNRATYFHSVTPCAMYADLVLTCNNIKLQWLLFQNKHLVKCVFVFVSIHVTTNYKMHFIGRDVAGICKKIRFSTTNKWAGKK